MTADTAMEFRITGRVQGVSFRAWTQAEAEARGLSGWVRNEADGSVTACLSGPAEALADIRKALWQGPPAAQVAQVAATPCPPPAGGHGVRIAG